MRSPRQITRFALLAALICATWLAGGVSSARAQQLGIAAGGDIQSLPAKELERELDLIAAAGARWLRVDINWAQIQAGGPAAYEWAGADRVIAGARERGLRVLGVIVWTPAWARPAGTSASYAPDPAAYAAFAARAVRRYSPDVRHWEIWNEPNVEAFWTPKPNAAAYAALLRAAAKRIRAADPKARVLTGGTAPAVSDGTDVAPAEWLRRLYAQGAKGHFDAVAHHPYCWPAFPGEQLGWSAWFQLADAKQSLRSLMRANGDGAKKIWATEFGAPTGGPAGSFVAEPTQAKMITRAARDWRGKGWAGPLFIYEARDHGTDRRTREDFFGLVRHDFSRKPAYAAYRRAALGDFKVAIKGTARKPRVAVRYSAGAAAITLRLERKAKGRWRAHSAARTVRTNGRGRAQLALRKLRRPLAKGAYRVRAALALKSAGVRLAARSKAIKLRGKLR